MRPRTLSDRHDQTKTDDDFEKCALELFRTASIKPRQIEHSGFFPTEDDVCALPALTRVKVLSVSQSVSQ